MNILNSSIHWIVQSFIQVFLLLKVFHRIIWEKIFILTNTFHYQLYVLQQNCKQKYFACNDLTMRNVHPCSNGLVKYYVKNANCLNKQTPKWTHATAFSLCLISLNMVSLAIFTKDCSFIQCSTCPRDEFTLCVQSYNVSTFSTHIKYSITLFSCVSHYVQYLLRNLRVWHLQNCFFSHLSITFALICFTYRSHIAISLQWNVYHQYHTVYDNRQANFHLKT